MEEIAERVIVRGEYEVFDTWMNDSESLVRCRNLIDAGNLSYCVSAFCLLVIEKQVERLFDFWSVEDQIGFANWYDSLLNNEAMLWESEQTPLYVFYSKLAGVTLAKGWNIDNAFRELLANRLKQETSFVFCSVLGEFATAMADLQNRDFGTLIVGPCVRYLFQALSLTQNIKEKRVVLKSLLSVMEYHSDGSADHYPYKTFDFDVSCIEVCCTPESLELIFDNIRLCPVECLDILTMFASATTSDTIPRRPYARFVSDMLTWLINTEIEWSGDSLNSLSRLALRTKLTLDNLQPEIPLIQFAVFMFEVSRKQMSPFVENFNAIQNIMEYWGTFQRIGFVSPELQTMRNEIAVLFIEKSFEALDNDQEAIRRLFCLSDTRIVHPMCSILRNIVGYGLPEFCTGVFLPIYANLITDQSGNTSAKVALWCDFALGICLQITLSSLDDNSRDAMIKALRKVLSTVVFDVFERHWTDECIMYSLIRFIQHFRDLNFMNQNVSISHVFYRSFGDIRTPNAMFNRLVAFVSNIMMSINNIELLEQAAMSLANLLTFSQKMDISSLEDFVQKRIDNQLPFINDPALIKCRLLLHYALAELLFRNKALCSRFLSVYDTVLEDPHNLLNFACDFTGMFRAAKTSDNFHLLFDYLFPQHLQRLIELQDSIVDVTTAKGLVKCWIALLNHDHERITFDHHSANGLKLFHMVTNMVHNWDTSFFEDPSFVQRLLTVLSEALSAPYVPFGAFSVFEDSTLIRMIGFYTDMIIPRLTLETITTHRKLENELQAVNSIIISKHLHVCASIEPLFNIALLGLKSLNQYIMCTALNSLESLLKNNLAAVNQSCFVQVALSIWHICFMNPGKWQYLRCLKSVIITDITILQRAYQQMVDAAVPEKLSLLEEAYRNLVEELGVQGENIQPKTLSSFVLIARSCVKLPHLLFV